MTHWRLKFAKIKQRVDSSGNLWRWGSAEVKWSYKDRLCKRARETTDHVSIMCFSWSFLFASWRSEGSSAGFLSTRSSLMLWQMLSRVGQISWSYQIFEVIMVTSQCDMKHVYQSYGIVAFLKCIRSDYYSPLIRFISVRWCLQQFPFPEKYLLSQQRHLKTNIIKNDAAKWAQMDKMEFPFR